MTTDRDGWKLPIDPLSLQSRHDRYRARIATLRERFGDDATAWPPLECARLMAESRDIDIALQVNWQHIYAEARRLGANPLARPGDE